MTARETIAKRRALESLMNLEGAEYDLRIILLLMYT
jgi:hypothetical protein